MEPKSKSALSDLIRAATNPKNEVVPKKVARQIKRVCKNSNAQLICAAHLLMDRIQMNNSRTRLLTLHLINSLFERSAKFRALMLDRLPELLDATLGLHSDLPVPVRESNLLKQFTLHMLCVWSSRFGERHTRLRIAAHYINVTLDMPTPTVMELQATVKQGLGKRSLTQKALKEIRSKRAKLNAIKQTRLLTKGKKANPNAFIALPNTFSSDKSWADESYNKAKP